jgi:uncharacterized protein YbjT (DUF2867 family)
MNEPNQSTSLRVVVFGATGTAGSGVLTQCRADSRVSEVVLVTRRQLGIDDPKLRELICQNFLDLEPLAEHLAGFDVCFYCLGVSQAKVRDLAKYREITYDYALTAARTLLRSSSRCTFHFLSGQGTNTRSRMMWARIKGETEQALQESGLAGVVFWRPGYIHPDGPRHGRQFVERLGGLLYPLFHRFPALTVSASELGRAMLQATIEGKTDGVIENRDIRALAERYQP